MKVIVWNPSAVQEVDNARAVSSDAVAFQRDIDEAIQDIADGRITHAEVLRSPCRQCILTRLPYSIIYTETPDEIRIVAFPHHKRRTGYWKRRLRPN